MRIFRVRVRHSLGTTNTITLRIISTATIRSIIISRMRDRLITWISVNVGVCVTVIIMAACIRTISRMRVILTNSLIRA